MGYKNEEHRAIAGKFPGIINIEIVKPDGNKITGDKISTCIVWNNLIGANMNNKDEHLSYLKNMGLSNNEKLTLTLLGDGKVLKTINFQI